MGRKVSRWAARVVSGRRQTETLFAPNSRLRAPATPGRRATPDERLQLIKALVSRGAAEPTAWLRAVLQAESGFVRASTKDYTPRYLRNEWTSTEVSARHHTVTQEEVADIRAWLGRALAT